jgi:hypothetical protein
MSKQLLVRKVKQTRTIISHAITDARNKEVSTEVAVMALMKGQATKKISCGLGSGRGAFKSPGQRRCVVCAAGCSGFSDINGLG